MVKTFCDVCGKEYDKGNIEHTDAEGVTFSISVTGGFTGEGEEFKVYFEVCPRCALRVCKGAVVESETKWAAE